VAENADNQGRIADLEKAKAKADAEAELREIRGEPLTLAEIRQMSKEEVDRNWERVSRSLADTREPVAAEDRPSGFEQRRRLVAEAKARVDELEAEQRKVAHSLDRAKGPLASYLEQLEADERDADPTLEAELTAAIREVEQAVTVRAALRGSERGGRQVAVEVVDDKLEARLAGARRRVDEAERAVEHYLRDRFDDLAAELVADGRRARDRFQGAWDQVREADAEWSTLLRRWQPLLAVGGISTDDMPAHPLAGLGPAVDRGVPTPAPRSVMPEGER